MYGKLNAKISIIDKMLEFYNTSNQTLDGYNSALETAFHDKQSLANDGVHTYLSAKFDCIAEWNTGSRVNDKCNALNHDYATLIDSLQKEAEAFADREDYPWKPRNRDDYTRYLNNKKIELNTQLDRLEALLGETNSFFNGILDADQLAVAFICFSLRRVQWVVLSP